MITFKDACRVAKAADDAARGRSVNGGWASRWYVTFQDKINAAQARAIKEAGFNWFQRPGSAKRHIYIGYCNFVGAEPARAEAVAKAFTDAGFPAYASDDGD